MDAGTEKWSVQTQGNKVRIRDYKEEERPEGKAREKKDETRGSKARKGEEI